MLGNIRRELGLVRTPGIFHRYMLEKFKLKAQPYTNILTRKEACYILGKFMKKDIFFKFLNEMEELDLIKRKNKMKIEILK